MGESLAVSEGERQREREGHWYEGPLLHKLLLS